MLPCWRLAKWLINQSFMGIRGWIKRCKCSRHCWCLLIWTMRPLFSSRRLISCGLMLRRSNWSHSDLIRITCQIRLSVALVHEWVVLTQGKSFFFLILSFRGAKSFFVCIKYLTALKLHWSTAVTIKGYVFLPTRIISLLPQAGVSFSLYLWDLSVAEELEVSNFRGLWKSDNVNSFNNVIRLFRSQISGPEIGCFVIADQRFWLFSKRFAI